MNDWRSLKRDPLPIVVIFRLLALVSAIGAGIVLGWRTFSTPQKSAPLNQSAEVSSNYNQSLTSRTIPIPETGVSAANSGEAVRLGSPAPDFTLTDLAGELYTLSDHLGQVVLINFWTTWCPPCIEEMPALQEAYDRYREQGFVVLGINWTEDDDREQIEPFIQELELTFPILLDIEVLLRS